MTLRIGSLCSGYEGLGMAVQAVLGGELAWVADPDPGAAAILAHHYPDVPNLGDITKTRWEDVTRVDVLCAGYPCQPFSDAGLRLGVEDERHIWPYIAGAIRVLRPRIVVLENVRGHLGRGFDVVLGDLADLGFDASWCTVRASEVGAPHRRERLFIVATVQDADGTTCGERRIAAPGQTPGRGPRPDAGRRSGAPAADAAGERHGDAGQESVRGLPASPVAGAPTAGGHAAGGLGVEVQHVDPVGTGAVGDGVRVRGPVARDDLGAQPGQRGTDLRLGTLAGDAAQVDGSDDGREVLRSGVHTDDHLCRQSGAQEPAKTNVSWGPYEAAIRRWEHVIGRPAPRPTEPGRTGERLSPAFVEWMMGLPSGHVTDVPGLSRNAQLKALGNGVVWQQGAAAIAHLLERRAVA